MAWFRVDDGWHSHPKVLSLGLAARGLWVTAGTWCSQHLTDGRVPTAALRYFGADDALAQELVDAGLWTRDAAGYAFHDWLEHQPSRASVEETRRSKGDRQSRWRQGKAASRRDASDADAARRDDERETNGDASPPSMRDASTDASPTPPSRRRVDASTPRLTRRPGDSAPSRPVPSQEGSATAEPSAVAAADGTASDDDAPPDATDPPDTAPSPATPKPPPQAPSAHQAVLVDGAPEDRGDHTDTHALRLDFERRFAQHCAAAGVTAVATWSAKCGWAAKRLVTQHGLAECLRRLAIYFDAPPPFLANGSRDFPGFAQHFDKLALPSGPSPVSTAIAPGGRQSPGNALRAAAAALRSDRAAGGGA